MGKPQHLQVPAHFGGGRCWGSGSAACKLCGSTSYLTFLGPSFLHWKMEKTSFSSYNLTENTYVKTTDSL